MTQYLKSPSARLLSIPLSKTILIDNLMTKVDRLRIERSDPEYYSTKLGELTMLIPMRTHGPLMEFMDSGSGEALQTLASGVEVVKRDKAQGWVWREDVYLEFKLRCSKKLHTLTLDYRGFSAITHDKEALSNESVAHALGNTPTPCFLLDRLQPNGSVFPRGGRYGYRSSVSDSVDMRPPYRFETRILDEIVGRTASMRINREYQDYRHITVYGIRLMPLTKYISEYYSDYIRGWGSEKKPDGSHKEYKVNKRAAHQVFSNLEDLKEDPNRFFNGFRLMGIRAGAEDTEGSSIDEIQLILPGIKPWMVGSLAGPAFGEAEIVEVLEKYAGEV